MVFDMILGRVLALQLFPSLFDKSVLVTCANALVWHIFALLFGSSVLVTRTKP